MKPLPVPSRAEPDTAFSLVELLVVMSIVAVLIGFAVPAFQSVGAAGNFTRTVSTVADTMEQARTFAMSQRTYVWVGFFEENDGASGAPRQPGFGNVVVTAVASKDGVRAYDPDAPGPLDPSRLQSVDKLARLTNAHLATAAEMQTFDARQPNASPLERRTPVPAAARIGDLGGKAATTFSYPVNGNQYQFTQVVEFDPRGSARIVQTAARTLPEFIEIGLRPTRGTATPGLDGAAVQVAGLTGATRFYRP